MTDELIHEPYHPPAITYEAPLVVYCGELEPTCGSNPYRDLEYGVLD